MGRAKRDHDGLGSSAVLIHFFSSPRPRAGVHFATDGAADEWIPDHAAERLSGMTGENKVRLGRENSWMDVPSTTMTMP
jgi:hypothetical protein